MEIIGWVALYFYIGFKLMPGELLRVDEHFVAVVFWPAIVLVGVFK